VSSNRGHCLHSNIHIISNIFFRKSSGTRQESSDKSLNRHFELNGGATPTWEHREGRMTARWVGLGGGNLPASSRTAVLS
jgi:hypothetical protein